MNRETRIEHLLERMRCYYVAESGLGRLPDFKTDTAIAPNGQESVRNQNGILYRMLAVIQAYRAKVMISALDMAILHMGLLRLRLNAHDPAITNRQPYGTVKPVAKDEMDSHDNAVGLLLAEWYLGINVTAPALIKHWWRNFGCINNLNPGKFDWAAFRQPGEVALYYIAAKRRAPFLFALWMFVGILLNARKVYPNGEASRLTFMRLFLIDQVGIKGFVQKWLYGKVRKFWFKRLVEKFGGDGISPIMLEYGEGHPIAEFQRLIDEA